MTIVADELLADILAVERDIRLRIDTLERQTAERLEAVRQELDRMLEAESGAMAAEREQALIRAEQGAAREADGLLDEARAFALRLEHIEDRELDRVFLQLSGRILPEGADDRQDEQT